MNESIVKGIICGFASGIVALALGLLFYLSLTLGKIKRKGGWGIDIDKKGENQNE